MANDMQKLLFEVADLKRKSAFGSRQGTIEEVKEDKIRVNMGEQSGGGKFMSPWLHTGNHRGGSRERKFFKKGQNVMMSSPDGDLRQAEVQAYAENNQYKAPDHASNSGQDEETYQQDALRGLKTKSTFQNWLQEPQQQQGGQQGQQGGGAGGAGGGGGEGGGGDASETPQKRQPQKADPDMVQRMNKEGYLTGRVKNAGRYAAHKEGAKIKMGTDTWLVVVKGKIIASHPIVIGKDPVPDDDKND